MSTPLVEREALNVQPRHRWTVAEYHRMGEVGLLHEDSRVKAPLYTHHGIPEVWLFDLQQR